MRAMFESQSGPILDYAHVDDAFDPGHRAAWVEA